VVGDDGRLVGIFTDGDLRRQLAASGKNLMTKKMSEFEYHSPITIPADSLLKDALAVFKDKQIDTIIVTDNGSVDGTQTILQEYAEVGAIVLIHEPGNDYRQSAWVTRMARRANDEFAVDWVINADADEFWRAADARLSLATALATVPDAAATALAWRHDLRGRGASRGGWLRRLRWLDRATVSERGTPLAPKVVHRAATQVTVAMGNHAVDGIDGEQYDSPLLEVVHLPLRSWQQFSQKIRTGGAAVNRNSELSPAISWHWRADYERLLDGKLEEQYWARSLRWVELLRGLSRGRFVRERRLPRELVALTSSALLPRRLAESLRS